ncbi:MAG: FtsW/RodA/SpoVE family cell cycle protein, partial [Planctomycetes bacterium]|nr:FtsW/RodA/SpoVE family cell cycle protein [Planctomycetota bacterium]
GFVPAAAFVAPLCALIIVQPDLGTSLFVGMLGFIVLIAGGLRFKHLAICAGAVMPIVLSLMFFKFDHVKTRIEVFLDPAADPLGKGHQILQSWTALGSGGFTGKGLGESTQKLFYLPEEHTDFIYAILVEETGFVGGGVVILLFLALIYAGHRVSKHAPDRFGALLAMGMTLSLVLQAAMNLAVVTGAVPTKGISLPLISYGGTGLVVALMQVGVVLSVARQAVSRSDVLKLAAIDAREATQISRRGISIAPGLSANHISGPAPRPL